MSVYKRDSTGRLIPKSERSKRSGTWYFDFQIRGVRYREAIPEARTQAQAERAEVRSKEDVYAGRYDMRRSPLFADFVEHSYRPMAEQTKRSFANADAVYLKPLVAFFGRYRLAEIAPLLIERYKRQRAEVLTVHGKERRPASINRELECLSRIFSVATHNGICNSNPCRAVRKLRQDNARNRYLSREEEERLQKACTKSPGYVWPLICIAIQTGMRRGELFKLEWGDVDISRKLVYVRDTKTGRDREIPLSPAAVEALEALPRRGPRVFGLTDVKRAWAGACRRAGIVGLRFHDLRHTAATRWADAGADAFTIAALLGHATIQMSARYTHAIDQNKRRAVEVAGASQDRLKISGDSL